MAYLEFVIPARSWSSNEKEILYALMAQIGFEGFVEGDDDIQAYIDEESYVAEELNLLIDELAEVNIRVQYRFHRAEDQIWNEEWEKKFDPVIIDERVLIRAPFHDSSGDLECTLVIEPKMSFGTGHHHTTKLMIREMGNHLLEGKRILDMGCGSGVLGIYACKEMISHFSDHQLRGMMMTGPKGHLWFNDQGAFKVTGRIMKGCPDQHLFIYDHRVELLLPLLVPVLIFGPVEPVLNLYFGLCQLINQLVQFFSNIGFLINISLDIIVTFHKTFESDLCHFCIKDLLIIAAP